MKNLLVLFCLVLFSITCFAQQEQYHPYKKFGSDIEVLTLSNGKYDEFFDYDSIAIVGSAVLNTKTMKVIGFVEEDTMYSEATMEPEVVSRWLSPDPLAREYPSMSPYNFTANNPIFFIDADGQKIYAYNSSSQDLVIKALNYAFGDKHGFSFVDNLLVQTGEPPKDLTTEQQLMFDYFNETLVKSTTPINVRANESLLTIDMPDGTTQNIVFEEGNAGTTPVPSTYKYGSGKMPPIIGGERSKIEILVTKTLMEKGINLNTKKGDKVFSKEYAMWHEWGHAVMDIIEMEFGGVYKDIDQSKMSAEEIQDWSIRFTNTINKDKGMSLETGMGQHERPKDGLPAKEPKPLTE